MADDDIDIADADERTRLIRPVDEDDSQWSRWLGGKIPRQQQRQVAPHSGSYYSSATNSTIGSEELGYIQREVLEEYEEMLEKEDYYGGKRHSSGMEFPAFLFMSGSFFATFGFIWIWFGSTANETLTTFVFGCAVVLCTMAVRYTLEYYNKK